MYTTSLFWDSEVRLGVDIALCLAAAEYPIFAHLCQMPFFVVWNVDVQPFMRPRANGSPVP